LDPVGRGHALRLLEMQHQAMLMYTSCAWFFSDLSGIETVQNLRYAARAIELAGPFAPLDLEAVLLEELGRARSNLEIYRDGRKLWERQYVDGNGGNISCRLTDDWVLCTPTLTSKGDLRTEDICLVDFDGRQLAGVRRRSSEILLHLAIMKAVPAARAVLHCHPPHATAFALVGQVPPVAMLAEHEVFIGPVALVPYETPGTQACADAVVPVAAHHNTILMANHGVVTWADSLTHAEWFVEVMDTTCRVLILAAQLGVPPKEIISLSAFGHPLRLDRGEGRGEVSIPSPVVRC